jgi:two-component system, OmpR family, osmolarity sensor histidine kinase EnvZ
MSFAPRSLFGRNLLLIVVPMALAELVSAVLVRELMLRPRLDQIGDGLARNVAALRAGLVLLPATERAAFVEAFNRRGLAGARDAAPEDLMHPGLTPLERRFVQAISARVASEGAEMAWRRDAGGSFAVRLTIEGTPYQVVLPGTLPAREFTGTWVAATIISVLLALVGAFAIQRRLNRPLERVVQAAGELARGAPPLPLPEDGPTEIASLARSFNQLVTSLAQTDRERALMLAGVSHDLRTPLTKLRLGVEIVSPGIEPQLTASMTRSIEEMDAIIGQFLDFARADAPGAAMEASIRCDIDLLAQRVASAAADHGQKVELVLGKAGSIRAREQALQRAIGNLVENAFKHGRVPVALRTGADPLAVWIEVCDEGEGVSPAEAESLKQPFRRAQSARSGAPGAGLGLAIVDRIVRAEGGRFELLANAPRGLRARISLPRSH